MRFAGHGINQLTPRHTSSLVFEPVSDPTSTEYAFYGRGAGYDVWFTAGAVELTSPSGGRLARIELVGANQHSTISGSEPVSARINYLRGNDHNNWRTDLTPYRRVHYHQIYPKIDFVFYSTELGHEFDFVLHPGADPTQLSLRLWGADTRLEPSGDLVFATPGGQFRLKKPKAYQGNQGVECNFVLKGTSGRTLTYRLGQYDLKKELIIDPVLVYSSYLGGGQQDTIESIHVDGSGNIYVTGSTNSVNLPMGFGPFQEGLAGGVDIFVSKLRPDGRTLIYSTYIGGDDNEVPLDLYVDGQGRVTVAGATRSADFPVQQPLQESYAGGTSDIVLFRLGSSGSQLQYSTFLGGSREEEPRAILRDGEGALFVTGFTASTDFPTTEAVFQPQSGGRVDAFVSKISATGSSLEFSTYLGGDRDEIASDLKVDSDGNVFVGGLTDSANFPVEMPLQQTRLQGNDAFVTSFNSDLTALRYSTFLGSRGNDAINALLLEPDASVVVAGETSGSDFPLRDPFQASLAGSSDAFITRIDSSGQQIVHSTLLGGSGFDSARDIRTDDSGNLTLTGVTTSVDLPVAGTLFTKQPGAETFVARLSKRADALIFNTYLGGAGDDVPNGLDLGPDGTILVAGSSDSVDLPISTALQTGYGSKGVYRSQNQAGNWQASGGGLTDPNILSLAVAPQDRNTVFAGTNNSGVFKSTDAGNSWIQSGLETGRIATLIVDPQNTGIVYAGGFGVVFKSENGGDDWESLSSGLPSSGINTICIDPSDSSTLFVGTNGRGVFVTNDGGEIWRAINNGLDDAGKVVFSLVIDPNDASKIYIGTQGAVYLSSNGGAFWETTSLVGVTAVVGLAIDPINTSIVYASGFSAIGNIVGRTEDGGVNWIAQPVAGNVSSLLVDRQNRNTVYAGTADAGIFRATDQGSTPSSWIPMSDGLGSTDVRALAASGVGSTRILAATQGGDDGFIAALSPENIFYFPQVADGQQGRIRFQTTLIFVNTGAATTVKIEFFSSDGNPMELPFEGLGTASLFELNLDQGESFSSQTLGQEEIRFGYAKVTTSDGVDGTAVFTRSDAVQAKLLYEAGVPASKALSNFAFILDSLQLKDTGIALVNSAGPGIFSENAANIELTLFDEDNNLIQKVTLDLNRGEHIARFITELFPDIALQVAEMTGIVTITSTQPLVAVTLRQRDDPATEFPSEVATLTPFPVITSNSTSSTTYVPQVGDGVLQDSRFQTSLILANTLDLPSLVTLEFFDSAGEPLELDLGEAGVGSRFNFFLSGNEFRFLQTRGEGELKVGYARITAGLGVGGTAVFTETDIPRNVILYEAGVAITTPRKRFSLFVSSLGVRDTGLAIVNTTRKPPEPAEGEEPEEPAVADVTLRLYDKDFNQITERTILLDPEEHLPRFVSQLFPGFESTTLEMEGLLTVESSEPLAAVTLRQNNDFRVPFPIEVPALTAFPVIPGVPE